MIYKKKKKVWKFATKTFVSSATLFTALVISFPFSQEYFFCVNIIILVPQIIKFFFIYPKP